MIKKSRKSFCVSDVIIVVFFFMIVFLMFLRSARHNDLYNSCQDPILLQSIIEQETDRSFLNKQANISWFDTTYYSIMDALSRNSFTNNLLLYFNPRYPLTISCTSCHESEECADQEEEPFFYPKQITLSVMKNILKTESMKPYHILAVQESNKEAIDLIYPVQTVSLFRLVDQLTLFKKEDPIFVIGRSYLETKIASETMVRAGFRRIYRVITLFSTTSRKKII